MNEFMGNYGVLVIVGLLFLLTFFLRRVRGLGCCGGETLREPSPDEKREGVEQTSGRNSHRCH